MNTGKEKNIKLINYRKNECFAVLLGHTGSVNDMKFSPTNKNYLLSSVDNFLTLLLEKLILKIIQVALQIKQ